jgi:hypothetical protein
VGRAVRVGGGCLAVAAAAAACSTTSVAAPSPPEPEADVGFRRRRRRLRLAAEEVWPSPASLSTSDVEASSSAGVSSLGGASDVAWPSASAFAADPEPDRRLRRDRDRLREDVEDLSGALSSSADPAASSGDGAFVEDDEPLALRDRPPDLDRRRLEAAGFLAPSSVDGSSDGPGCSADGSTLSAEAGGASAVGWFDAWDGCSWAEASFVDCWVVLRPPPRPRPPRRRRRGRGRGSTDSSPPGCAGTSSVIRFLLREPGAPVRPAGRAAPVARSVGGLGRHDRYDDGYVLKRGHGVCRGHRTCVPFSRGPTAGAAGSLTAYQRLGAALLT